MSFLHFVNIVNLFAFAFMSYLVANNLRDFLQGGKLLKPALVTISAITISFHFYKAGVTSYILACFVGFFAHTCMHAYKKDATTKKPRKPKSEKVNP